MILGGDGCHAEGVSGDGRCEANIPVFSDESVVNDEVHFDGSVLHVHGQPVTVTEEGFNVEIGGELLSVAIDGDNVLVNGELMSVDCDRDSVIVEGEKEGKDIEMDAYSFEENVTANDNEGGGS